MTEVMSELFKEAKRRRLTDVAWQSAANVDRKTIRSVRAGGKNPGLTTIVKLGRGLGWNLKWEKSGDLGL